MPSDAFDHDYFSCEKMAAHPCECGKSRHNNLRLKNSLIPHFNIMHALPRAKARKLPHSFGSDFARHSQRYCTDLAQRSQGFRTRAAHALRHFSRILARFSHGIRRAAARVWHNVREILARGPHKCRIASARFSQVIRTTSAETPHRFGTTFAELPHSIRSVFAGLWHDYCTVFARHSLGYGTDTARLSPGFRTRLAHHSHRFGGFPALFSHDFHRNAAKIWHNVCRVFAGGLQIFRTKLTGFWHSFRTASADSPHKFGIKRFFASTVGAFHGSNRARETGPHSATPSSACWWQKPDASGVTPFLTAIFQFANL